MKTFIKFRVGIDEMPESLRSELHPFRPIGSSVAELVREFDSPIVQKLFRPASLGQAKRSWFISYFEFDYRYTKAEFDASAWFYGRVVKSSNDFCDQERTRYDTTYECPFCGVGRRQVSPLILPNISRKPSDAVFCLANGNYLCRRDLAETLVTENLTGFRLIPVATSIKMVDKLDFPIDLTESEPPYVRKLNERAIAMSDVFAFQLLTLETLDISPQVWIGVTPFAKNDSVDMTRCPLGHTLGHRLLSPLAISGADRLQHDFHSTSQHIGGHGGYFWPARNLLFSERATSVLGRFRHKGIAIDPLICTS